VQKEKLNKAEKKKRQITPLEKVIPMKSANRDLKQILQLRELIIIN
jgi:hypothetical protein